MYNAKKAGEIAVAGGILALGVFLAAQTWLLPDAPGYAKVGPRVFPGVVSAGVIICGLMLLREAWRVGFVGVLAGEGRAPFAWRPFLWLSAGVIFHMAMIGTLGFIAASTVLFAACARAFGSRAIGRNLGIGLLLATAIFFLFTEGLGLSLPVGQYKAWLVGA